MSYRVSKQDNGLWTIHDVSIFAKCKRGAVDYDEKWMDTAVDNANIAERYGYCPPAFVKHNSFDKLDSTRKEDADGRVANMRRRNVRCRGGMKPGIVADLRDLDFETADRICKHKLNGRSIESLYPSTRQQIDGLALLGRTKPYFELAQGSEPSQQNFSAIERDGNEGQLVFLTLEDETTETFNMIPGQGAPGAAPAAAPAQPAAPGGLDVNAVKQAAMALFQALGMGGGQAPAAPAPAPQSPPPAASGPARMQAAPSDAEKELELLKVKFQLAQEQLKTLNEQSTANAAVVEQASEVAKAAKEEREYATLFSELQSEGCVFTQEHVREQVAKFGFDTYRAEIKPMLLRAPVGAPPAQLAQAPAAPAKFQGTNDPDLQPYAALSPELRQVAFSAAAEYDANAHSASFTQNNPRDAFIAAEVRDAKRAQ